MLPCKRRPPGINCENPSPLLLPNGSVAVFCHGPGIRMWVSPAAGLPPSTNPVRFILPAGSSPVTTQHCTGIGAALNTANGQPSAGAVIPWLRQAGRTCACTVPRRGRGAEGRGGQRARASKGSGRTRPARAPLMELNGAIGRVELTERLLVRPFVYLDARGPPQVPHTVWEDPFVYLDARGGWHLVSHVYPTNTSRWSQYADVVAGRCTLATQMPAATPCDPVLPLPQRKIPY